MSPWGALVAYLSSNSMSFEWLTQPVRREIPPKDFWGTVVNSCSGVVTKAFTVVKGSIKSRHLKRPLSIEKPCSRCGWSATEGIPNSSLFQVQLSDPSLCGDLEETWQKGWRAHLYFTGSLVVPQLPTLFSNYRNLTLQGWKSKRRLRATIPFWEGKPRWVNLENTRWGRRRVLTLIIISRAKFPI